nr:MAG TPA: hypothetical protein [Caudoviricetes sp.]
MRSIAVEVWIGVPTSFMRYKINCYRIFVWQRGRPVIVDYIIAQRVIFVKLY